ncbi:MAG TPA: ferric reductase-like transmembrane domain-containing protein, partial [Chloroflexota bacterium]
METNNELASGRRVVARWRQATTHSPEEICARPGHGFRRAAQALMSWALSIVVLGIAAVILGLWLHGGGVTAVHDVAGAFISVGRLTGLLGAYLLLIQVLLVARLPFLEWIAGFDKLTRWHRVNGKACLYLILAHVATITIGYAMTDRLSIPAEFSVLL